MQETESELVEPAPDQCLSKAEVMALKIRKGASVQYIPEFKREVVRYMDAHKLNSFKVASIFGIGFASATKWKAAQQEEEEEDEAARELEGEEVRWYCVVHRMFVREEEVRCLCVTLDK